jgi:hypothetical protein
MNGNKSSFEEVDEPLIDKSNDRAIEISNSNSSSSSSSSSSSNGVYDVKKAMSW